MLVLFRIAQEVQSTLRLRRKRKMSTSGDDGDFVSARTHLSTDCESLDYAMRHAVENPSPLRSFSGPDLPSYILSDAENQVLDDEVDRLMAAIQDVSNATNVPPPFRNLPSSEEPSSVLSDEENDGLNEKIDRLMAAIQDGRQLRFSPDPETGEINISAAYNKEELDDVESDLEALIAAAPENFGTINRPGDRRRRMRSINSITSVGSSSSQARSRDSSNAWKRVVAAANIRDELEHSSVVQDPTVIRRPLRPQLHGVDGNKGRYLAFMDKGKLMVSTISPIPIDFNKRPRAITPSIHSSGSEPDSSSPLFERSTKAMLKYIDGVVPESGTQEQLSEIQGRKESVSSWLQRVETPPRGEKNKNTKGKERAFDVFEDEGGENAAFPENTRPVLTLQALKDISNLRRPGYLQKNSFANDKALQDDSVRPTHLWSPFLPFGGASDRESRRDLIDKKWPALLAGKKHSKKQNVVQTGPLSEDDPSIATNKPQQSQPPGDSTSAAQPAIDEDPERAAHFDFALTRLEGRVPPPPSSPIQRYAITKDVYGPDVQLENSRVRRYNPRPRAIQHAVEKLEAVLAAAEAGADDSSEGREEGAGEAISVQSTTD